MLGHCLVADVPLQYMYSIEFNNSLFTSNITKSASYQLMNVPQGIHLEITITPTLPSQGLTGASLTSTVNLGKLCELYVLDPWVSILFVKREHVPQLNLNHFGLVPCKTVTFWVMHACVKVTLTVVSSS